MTDSISRKFARLGSGVSETGTLTVNSATASKWATARTITLSGDLSGNVSIDGSENVTLTATVSGNTVALGTDTTGNYIAEISAGAGITVSGSGSETATATISIDNTVATLSGSQTLTNKTISGATNTLSNIANNSLTNSSITVNGTTIALGSSGTLVTDDIAEDGTPVNLWFTNARARGAVSATDAGGDGSFSYDSGTGVFTYTGPSASEVRAHFSAGTGLTYSSGQYSLATSGVTANTYGSATAVPVLTIDTYGRITSASTASVSSSISIAGDTGTDSVSLISDTLTFTGGTGITSAVTNNTVTFDIDNTVTTNSGSQTLTNKTISGADNTLSNIGNSSLTNSSITINGTSTALGGTRTLVTDDIAEDGSPVNLWFTNARARNAISVTDSGGDGSLAYDSGTGVITYTGPSATEVRAHFTAGTGVAISSGQVSIGQAVGTTDNVTFAGATIDAVRVGVTTANEIDTSSGNLTLDSTGGTVTIDDNANITGNLTIDGNLTVSGTTVTINATNLAVEDNMIYLNNGSQVTNPDLGFAGNYNDGTYRHAGLFRDATDGVWKFFHQYTPEPDASAYIDITHGSFALAAVQASSFTGNLTGNVTGNVTGNASTATAWATGRTLTLSGDVTGTSAAFDGSGNISITTTIAADSVALGTDTSGNYVASITNGSYITGADGGSEGAALTLAVDATSANTVSKVVARDGSGNFSAGTITANLTGNVTGNASTATTLQTARNINGVSFNGSADITVADSTKLPLAGGTLTGQLNTAALVVAAGNVLYLYRSDNTAFVNWDARPDGGNYAVPHKYTFNNTLGTYGAYKENWWDGDTYHSIQVVSNAFRFDGNIALHAGNYNSYSPTLTGTGASGTWGINITGNAATATSATDSTKLPLAGGTMTGVLLTNTSSALATSDYTRIMHPGGASYVTQSPTVTGAIKIKMPVLGTGMMMTATVKVYEYSTGKSFELVFGGHRDGANWYNEFCYMVGDESRDEINVRFGIDATTNCIWIGETNSSWSYPQVFVTDVQLGYAGYSASWTTGWSISFVTSFDTVNRGPRTARRQITSGNYSSYALPLSGGTMTGALSWSGGTSINDYTGTYGSLQITGGNGSFDGVVFPSYTNTPTIMFDNNGGGLYYQTGTPIWGFYYNRVNTTLHIGSSGTSTNIVLHSGNYSSYALPLSGGTMTGDLVVNSNWGAGPYTEQFVIYGTYPSWTTRSTTSGTGWLFHTDGTGEWTLYSILGEATNNWTQRYTFNRDGTFRNGGPSGSIYLHAGNYSSYALPLSGGTVSGTVAAAYLTAAGYHAMSSTIMSVTRNIGASTNLDTDLDDGGAFSSYGSANTSWNAPFGYGGVMGFRFTSGIRAQFGFDIRHNNSDYGNLWYRTSNNLGWSTWRTMLHTGNYSSYALPISGGTMTGTATFAQGANITFGNSTNEAGPWTISINGSGGATPATKGTGYGRNLIVVAGASDNSSGLAGGDLFLRGGAPTAPSTVYGDVWTADLGGRTFINNPVVRNNGSFVFRVNSGSLPSSASHINLADSTGDPSDVVGGSGITWGSRSDGNPYYMIYKKSPYNNGVSTHSRLTLAWHTGVEIGGNPAYGGTRFFNDAPFTGTEIMSVGKGDSNVRINNRLFIGGTTTPDVELSVNGAVHFGTGGNFMYWGGTAGSVNSWSSREYSSSGTHTINTSRFVVDRVGYGSQALIDASLGSITLGQYTTLADGGRVNGTIRQGNNLSRPMVDWSASGTSTGMVIFYLPGNTGNYGMVHMVFDIYEYSGNTVSTVIVGGHNWGGSWYNIGCNVVGNCGKTVRLGVKDGQYCVVFGGVGSSWSYGTIVLRKIHNGGFYNNIMDLGSGFTASQTNTESFSNISSDLRNFYSPTDITSGSAMYSYNWFRSYNATGWYNQTYGGGIWMEDSTWVKIYGTKDFYATASIAAVGNITAYYSDERLKNKVGVIDNALEKIQKLSGFLYMENDVARSVGYTNTKQQVGVSAQSVREVLPEAVSLAPFDMETNPVTGEITSKSGKEYLTVDYSRLVPLLIEAIKEQQKKIEELEQRINNS